MQKNKVKDADDEESGDAKELPSKLGCSSKNPARGCWDVVEMFKWKKSGYYWI